MLVSWLRCEPDCFLPSLSPCLAFGLNCCEATGYEKKKIRDDICLHPEVKANERFRYELTSPFCFTAITQAGNFCRSGGFSSFLPSSESHLWRNNLRRCDGIPADREVSGMFWHLVAVKYCLHTRRKNGYNSREISDSQWQVPVCFLFLFLSLVKIKSTCLSQQREKSPCGAVSSLDTSRFQTYLLNLCTLTGWKVGGREKERERGRGRMWEAGCSTSRGSGSPDSRQEEDFLTGLLTGGKTPWSSQSLFLQVFFQTERVDCFSGSLHTKGKCLWLGRIRKHYRGWGGVGGVKGWICTPPLFPVTI